MQVLRTGVPIENKVYYYFTRGGNLVYSTCTIYPLYTKEKELLGVVCYSIGYTDLARHMENVQHVIEVQDSKAPGRKKAVTTDKHYSFASIVGKNQELRKAVAMAEVAATSSASVMLIGETGVGKEVFAQAIHYGSSRRARPYTAINCSAVPEPLLEGILFGTSRGAFTGALDKPGLFETTNGGTFFLDEVDSMPIFLQSKLLRALQEKKIRRVGDAIEKDIDVRILCAVGQHPKELLSTGALRPDIYYRLGAIKIFLPPLKNRMDDIVPLSDHFLAKHNPNPLNPPPRLSEAALALLSSHSWPGNVRELEHVLEAAISVGQGVAVLDVEHLTKSCPDIFPPDAVDVPPEVGSVEVRAAAALSVKAPLSVIADVQAIPDAEAKQNAPEASAPSAENLLASRKDMEMVAILDALGKAAGNKSLASRLLGISPQLLSYKIKKFGINAKSFVPKQL